MIIKEFHYLSFSYLECAWGNLLPSIFKIWNKSTHSVLQNQSFCEMYKIEQLTGGSHFEKIIFFPSKTGGCMMLSNYADGMESMTHIISKQLKINILNFRISSNRNKFPVNSLSCISSGEMLRTVYALKDNKWVFYSCGKPLWFENPEYYTNRLIKDRINECIISKYCNKLGLDILDSAFWATSDGVVIERINW